MTNQPDAPSANRLHSARNDMPVQTLGRRSFLASGAGLLAVTATGIPAARALSNAGALPAARLERVTARAAALPQLHALVIGHGGRIVRAEAFRGPPLDRPVNIKSVSKTIVASLTGTALAKGVLRDVDQPLSDAAPALIPADADPAVGRITIADLLTMQAGLERTSGANYGRWVQSADWVAFALSRPLVAAPGSRMLYSTGSYHVLGAVLAERAGRSLLSLARDWLGAPLGIDIPPWTQDPQGFYMGGNNMALSPLALFRFGEVWRRGGTWEGAGVVPADWIDRSWTPRTLSPFSGDQYGYGWFLDAIAGHRIAYARGYGGQMVYVVPSLELTVVMTSDPTRPARSGGHVGDLNALLRDLIVGTDDRGNGD